ANLESTKYAAKAATDGGLSTTGYEVGSDLALGPKVFPDNWVKIPGNSSFGTSDFYVMKYEAKCASASNNALLTTPATIYNTLWDSSSTPASACTAANSKYVTSAADGFPLTYVTHNTAKTYCTSIGAHLLTNEEYMTIARNAEQVAGNWSTSVGSGYLYSGHNDNTPATALTASQDDANGYYGTSNASGNQRRALTLSNGQTVWDLAGNIWEHVQRTAADIVTAIDLPACSDGVAGWGYCQYGATTAPYVSAYTADVAQAAVGPSNTDWNSTQGMGQVYSYKNGTDQATTVFIRGGGWNNGSYAGAFTLGLSWGTGDADFGVGFRCAR
ncbi:MAG: SUMF1/EgtB/PvdO family nonheme iron enzyme, partial [bacterium]|nr:SUMF1/EgtB/PvdO family nonheme iron enzyme [bacterium]